MKKKFKSKTNKSIERKKKVKPKVFTARTGQKPPKISSTYTFFFLLSIAGLVISFSISTIYQNQKVLFYHNFDATQLRDSLITTPEFTIPKGLKIVEFEFSSTVSLGSEFSIEGDIYDEDDLNIGLFEGELYNLAGNEGGESWSEKIEKTSQFFRVDGAGKYQIEFFLHTLKGSYSLNNLAFSVKTGEKSVAQMFEYLFWGFICLISLLICGYFETINN